MKTYILTELDNQDSVLYFLGQSLQCVYAFLEENNIDASKVLIEDKMFGVAYDAKKQEDEAAGQ